MIEKADFERVWLEVTTVFQTHEDPVDGWLAGTGIDADAMIEFVDEKLQAMLLVGIALAMEDGGSPEQLHSSLTAVACTLFCMGWEMHRQLGKPSTQIA